MGRTIEENIAKEILQTINKLKLPFRLDRLTEGKGDCFPLCVIAQCKRKEIYNTLSREIQALILQDDPTLFRRALKDFILKSEDNQIRKFRENYEEVVRAVDNRSWSQYWDVMIRQYEWVDYTFVQSTAWFLNHDILIIGTTGTEKDPYISINGNLKNEDQSCSNTPLVMGCKSNVHYQSLLPSISPMPKPSKRNLENKKQERKTQNTFNDMKKIEANPCAGKELQFSYKIQNNYKIFYVQSPTQIRCPFCTRFFKNIHCHLQKSGKCSVPNVKDFSSKLQAFLSQKFSEDIKQNQRERKAKSNAQLREKDNEKFKKEQTRRKAESDANLRNADNEKFKIHKAKRKAESDSHLRNIDNELFKKKQAKRKRESDTNL